MAPSVAITSPAANAQVSDILNVTAIASDNVGIVGVQFLVDGVNAGVEDTAAPYALAWDSRTVANGAHTLTARARDAAGNSTLSAPVPVNVANASSFQNEILATGLNLPTSMVFLPDGRMLVSELPGTIKVLSPPYTSVSPTPFLQLTNVGNDGYAGLQQGIFSIALDPNFATNHYYYVFYTTRTPNRDRLSRFTADATLTTTNLNTEVVLYQDPQDANTEHHGGAIVFGNDGKLYFTTGDHFQGTAVAGPDEPARKDPSHQPGRDGADRQPVLRRERAERRLDLGARSAQSLPRLLRRADRQALRRRRRRQRPRYRQGGGQPRRGGRQLRLAEQSKARAPAPARARSTRTPHNGRDAVDHRRLRLPRDTVPEQLPGQLLLRGLRAELDQAADASTRAGTSTASSTSNRRTAPPTAPTATSCTSRRGPTERSTTSISATPTPAARSASARSGGSAIRAATSRRSRSRRRTPTRWAGAAGGQLLERGLVRSRGPGADVRMDVRRRRHLDRGEPEPHLRAGRSVLGAALGLGRREHDVLDADLDQRRQPADGDDPRTHRRQPSSAPETSSRSAETPPTLMTARCPRRAYTWTIDFLHDGHVHPGASQTGVKSGTFTIPTSGHDFSGNTRYRIALTVTDSSGLTDTRSVLIYPRKVNLSLQHGPGRPHRVSRRRRQDDTVRLRHADRLQPYDRGPQSSLGRDVVHVRFVVGRRRADAHDHRAGAPIRAMLATFQASAAPPAIAA